MTQTPRPPRPVTELVVTDTERLTPGMVRVRFRAADPAVFAERFEPSVFTDRYVKLAFAADGRPATADESDVVLRTYTALDPDVGAGTLAIDFVVHGDQGLAGPWAARAVVGERILARGPGGAYAPDPSADWHLFAGDEAGLPAIRAALAALPPDARGYAVIEAHAPDHVQPLPAPVGVDVRWVHGGDGVLERTVRELPWLPGRVHAFVHGEAQAVMHGIRPHLLKERGLPRADVSISGYWRQGRTEEGFRTWKAELAAADPLV